MPKDAYYFSHDANAFNDPKIVKLRQSHGLEGYGVYFAILELMRNEKDYKLCIEDDSYLPFILKMEEAKLKQILSKCLAIGLFEQEGHKLFSNSFLSRMSAVDKMRKKRRDAGRKGGNAKAKLKQNSSNELKERDDKIKEQSKSLNRMNIMIRSLLSTIEEIEKNKESI